MSFKIYFSGARVYVTVTRAAPERNRNYNVV